MNKALANAERDATSGGLLNRIRSLLKNPLSLFVVMSLVGTMLLFFAVRFLDAEQRNVAERLESQALISVDDGFAYQMGSYYDDVLFMADTQSLQNFLDEPTVENRVVTEDTFAALARSRPDYMQLRYIDANGQEQIRIDRHGNEALTIPEANLQNKSSRDYFLDSNNLNLGQIYVSQLDLNVENGEVQVPWQPTLRIATPVFDEDGSRAGVVVLNISSAGVIGQIQNARVDRSVHVYLTNDNSYWIGGRPNEELWGFMFGHQAGAHEAYSDVWNTAQSQHSGLMWHGSTLLAYVWLDPIDSIVGISNTADIAPTERWLRIAELPGAGVSLFFSPIVWGIWLIMVATFALTAWKVREAQRQKLEVVLRERFLQALIDCAPDAVVTIGEDGRIASFSQSAVDMFGYSEKEAIGQPVSMLMPDSFGRNHQKFVSNYLAAPSYAPTATRHTRELTARDKNGNHMPIGLNLGDLGRNQRGRFVAIIRDITEQKKSEAELMRQQQEAVMANRAKSAFLANMSHELRTPLNAIIGYSEMLLEEAEDVNRKEFVPDLQRIKRAGQHLLALINDVLDLSKIEAGKQEINPVAFSLPAMSDEIESTARVLATKNNNNLRIEEDFNGVSTVFADELKIRQILLNLVSNACKFTSDGDVSVHMKADPITSEIHMEVSDTGVGMNEAYLAHVFTEFTQEESHLRKQFEGTGLGLAICKKLIEMMGGEIAVVSEKDVGTTITVHIPYEDAPDTVETATHAAAEHERTERKDHEALMSGMTVLVIDDDPNARDLVARYLIREGLQVATASSGEEGLALAEKLKPDAIILDILMKGLNGFEVLARIKASPELNATPVIMCSILDERERGISLGAVGYLTKPFDSEQLINVLERHLLPDNVNPVLIIEDNSDSANIISRQLHAMGVETVIAENGVIAFERLQDMDVPSLILLDLMMPEMDGFTFLHSLRNIPEYDEVPVVVVSAKELTSEERNELLEDVENTIEKGATDLQGSLRKLRAQLFKNLKDMRKMTEEDAA